ncbi:MAG: DUF721 domain-containing protein [Fibrobacteres bacterium]|nr:DUF721 domain-containing protein [Fibrobacterota bacterium]
MNSPRPDRWLGGKDLDRFRRKERARDDKEAEPVAGLLGNYLERSSLGAALMPASPAFQKAWSEVAGPLASRCTPCKWENGVLWVDVPDPGWKFELRWRLGELAQAMRDRGISLRQIRIR